MNYLFDPAYYLEVYPSSDFQYSKLSALIFVGFLVAAFLVHWIRKTKTNDPVAKKLLRRYPSRLVGFASVFLFLWLCREASLPYLSMKLWWVLLGLYFLYWMITSLLQYRKDYDKRSEQKKVTDTRRRYLPKKKR